MMKEKVKALWKLCFDEDDEFIDLYFRYRYTSQTNRAIVSGNEVISALQMIPYPMNFCHREVETAYVSGACTHPDYRGNGVMKELLSQAFAQMSQGRVAFSTLIPADRCLFDYYAHMGYAPVFQTATRELTLPPLPPLKETVVVRARALSDKAYEYLSQRFSARPCGILHTREDLQVVMKDLAISRGGVFIASGRKGISGIAIMYKEKERVRIDELFADNIETENALLHHIGLQTDCRKMRLRMPPTDKTENTPLGMARIIGAKEVLELYAAAHPKEVFQLSLIDKELSSNNGFYYLANGSCVFSRQRLPGAHLQMDIRELTSRIMTPLHPYMSLMME